jgi:hypothetical protein
VLLFARSIGLRARAIGCRGGRPGARDPPAPSLAKAFFRLKKLKSLFVVGKSVI